MPSTPVNNAGFSPQAWQVGYLTFDGGKTATEIESFDYDLSDGGQDVKTLMRGYGGRRQGAAMTTLNFSGEVPYTPSDTGGAGFGSGGMVTGKGVPLDRTMLTNLNGNAKKPISFTCSNGAPAMEQYVFSGYINTIKVTATLNTLKFTGTATGTFSVHESP